MKKRVIRGAGEWEVAEEKGQGVVIVSLGSIPLISPPQAPEPGHVRAAFPSVPSKHEFLHREDRTSPFSASSANFLCIFKVSNQKSQAQLNHQTVPSICRDGSCVLLSLHQCRRVRWDNEAFNFSFVMVSKMGQWVNMSTAKPDNPSLIPRTHRVEREN